MTVAATQFQFGLSHGDLSLKNTRVDGDTVHLIDWGCAQAHAVPHYDLGVVLADSLADDSAEFGAMLDGYGLTRQEYGAIRDEVRDLLLLEAIDKVRWSRDRNSARLAEKVARLRRLIALPV
jgi:tRNA A-37 threonylcarbamoyl transferase component Bud32